MLAKQRRPKAHRSLSREAIDDFEQRVAEGARERMPKVPRSGGVAELDDELRNR